MHRQISCSPEAEPETERERGEDDRMRENGHEEERMRHGEKKEEDVYNTLHLFICQVLLSNTT